MYSHMMVGSNDIARSKKFYDALFGAMGGPSTEPDSKGRLAYQHKGSIFLVAAPLNGEPAYPANGATIGFAMDSPADADAWHDAGVANGGTSVEDPPGIRESEYGPLYLAYLRDPDGNKLCAIHWVKTAA